VGVKDQEDRAVVRMSGKIVVDKSKLRDGGRTTKLVSTANRSLEYLEELFDKLTDYLYGRTNSSPSDPALELALYAIKVLGETELASIMSFAACPRIRENIVMNLREFKDVFRQILDYLRSGKPNEERAKELNLKLYGHEVAAIAIAGCSIGLVPNVTLEGSGPNTTPVLSLSSQQQTGQALQGCQEGARET